MRFIAPRTGAPEITLAEDQTEYMPITVAAYKDRDSKSPIFVARATFTDEERLAIANGEDIYITVMTYGRPFSPINVLVGPQWLTVEET